MGSRLTQTPCHAAQLAFGFLLLLYFKTAFPQEKKKAFILIFQKHAHHPDQGEPTCSSTHNAGTEEKQAGCAEEARVLPRHLESTTKGVRGLRRGASHNRTSVCSAVRA